MAAMPRAAPKFVAARSGCAVLHPINKKKASSGPYPGRVRIWSCRLRSTPRRGALRRARRNRQPCSKSKTCTSTSSPRAASCARSKASPTRCAAAKSSRSSANRAAANRCPRSRSCGCSRSPPAASSPGRILFEGATCSTSRTSEMREIRGRDIAMIFQEPMTSLNPVLTDRLPDHGAAADPPRDGHGGGARARDRAPAAWSASPTPSAGSTSTRTSSRAACASA